MNAKPAHASYHLESQVDLRIAGDSTKGVNVEAARLMSVLGQLLTSRRTLDLVCFVPETDVRAIFLPQNRPYRGVLYKDASRSD
jgi:hypothetical protein